MNNKIAIFLALGFVFAMQNTVLKADEGMWIPLLLKKYNIEDMQEKGFHLTADEIYTINKASMKDAVMLFGGGCTAELISNEGLIITNYHCGFSQVQSHSSLENDYLTNGFWAMNRNEELQNSGLSVTFLVRMEDVTDKILHHVTDSMPETERQEQVELNMEGVITEATNGTHYDASIKPFYFGNEYYLFVTETYSDVRLVGAPPAAIGKFGGDTDNWIWPRHTGDFSLFRIYADKNNNPADYSPDNIPFIPKKFFPVSLKGYNPNDFTMVFGYPGATEQYLTSYAVNMIQNSLNPHRINIRQHKIDIMGYAMDTSALIRIQYAAKYNRISNYWKKWHGENKGLERLDAIKKKTEYQEAFQQWTDQETQRQQKYGHLLEQYKNIYRTYSPIMLAKEYAIEAGYSLDPVKFAALFAQLQYYSEETDPGIIRNKISALKKNVEAFYKNYNVDLDKQVFREVLNLYFNNKDLLFFPQQFNLIKKKFKGDCGKYVDHLYKKSIFLDEEKLLDFLNNYSPSKSIKELDEDPLFQLQEDIISLYWDALKPLLIKYEAKIDSLNRIYINGLRAFDKERTFYPDANLTLRVAYGNVKPYEPKDGVKYNYYTTLSGIIEKDNPDIYDYNVPEKLKQLFFEKDFGLYGIGETMPVCFIASNHTTGGNSGSPVINGDGHLIGLNFDRNWEGTMSDIMYNPDQCRNISLDIRFALFIIDKFAGAGYLLHEMELVK